MSWIKYLCLFTLPPFVPSCSFWFAEGLLQTDAGLSHDLCGDTRILESLAYTSILTNDIPEYTEAMLMNTYDKIPASLGKRKDYASAPHCDHGDLSPSHRYEPLACWLWNLTAQIPDQTFKHDMVTLKLRNMACTNFEIGSIQSSFSTSAERNDKVDTKPRGGPSLSLGVAGISASCLGKYSAALAGGKVHASVQDNKSNDDPLSSPVELIVSIQSKTWKDGNRSMLIAESANTTWCKAMLIVPPGGLKFTGSLSAHLIDLFSNSIASHVSSALSTEICPVIVSELDPLMCNTLRGVNSVTTGWIHNNTSHEQREDARDLSGHKELLSNNTTDENALDFHRDLSLLSTFLLEGNNFINTHLNEGLIAKFFHPWDDDECTDCGAFFRGTNGLIKSLTKENGTLSVNISNNFRFMQNMCFVIHNYGHLELTLLQLNVSGLNHFQNLTALQPFSGRALSTHLNIEHGLDLAAAFKLKIQPEKNGTIHGQALHETFVLHVNTSSIDLSLETILLANKTWFETFTIGDMLTAYSSNSTESTGVPHALECLASSLVSLSVSTISSLLEVDHVAFLPCNAVEPNSNESKHSLESDLDALLNNALALFVGNYGAFFHEAIAAFAAGPFRDIVNKELTSLVEKYSSHPIEPSCRATPSDDLMPNYFNFNKSAIVKKLHDFFGSTKTISQMNKYADCVRSFMEGSLSSHMPELKWDLGDFEIIAKKIELPSLGTIDELEIIKPVVDDYHVENHISLCGSDDFNTSCSSLLSLTVINQELGVESEVNVSFRFQNISVDAGAIVLLDQTKFNSMFLQAYLDSFQCMFLAGGEMDLLGFSGEVGLVDAEIKVNVTGYSLGNFTVSLSLLESQGTDSVLAIMPWFLALIEDVLNAFFSGNNLDSSGQCPHRSPAAPRSLGEHNKQDENVWWVFATVLLGMIFSNIFYVCFRSRLTHVSVMSSSDTNSYIDEQDGRNLDDHVVNVTWQNSFLMFSYRISVLVRYLFPMLLVCTMVVLLSSNLSTGASIDIKVTAPAGKSIYFPSLFVFSFGNTVREMYQAGIYPLMLLVVVFSGLWPYLKLALMVAAWIIPKEVFSIPKREKLLVWLDALGKFSLVDAFVLVLMLVAFRYHLDVVDVATFDVFVQPWYGFYGFLFVLNISLVSGHVILFLHRRSDCRSEIVGVGQSVSVWSHVFEDPETRDRKRLSRKFLLILGGLIFLTHILLAVGVSQKSFNFEFGGLAGIALGDKRSCSYSLLSLGQSIPLSVEDPASLGIQWIQATYFFYALIMPFACLGMIFLLLFSPMSLHTQRRAFVMAEITRSWSAVEVFVISIVAALFEISTFASFIIGDKCDLINKMLVDNFGPVMQGGEECFTVQSSLGWNSLFLLAAVALNSILVFVVLRLVHQTINDRERAVNEDASFQESGSLVVFLLRSRFRNFLFSDENDCHEEGSFRDMQRSISMNPTVSSSSL